MKKTSDEDIMNLCEMKSNYCRDNGIKLLSISYKEFDNLYKIIKNNV